MGLRSTHRDADSPRRSRRRLRRNQNSVSSVVNDFRRSEAPLCPYSLTYTNSETSLQLPQHLKYVLIARYLAEGIDLGERQLAVLVHDKYGPLIDPGERISLALNPENPGYFPMRIKIACHAVWLGIESALMATTWAS